MNYIDDIDVKGNRHKNEYYYWECQELVKIISIYKVRVHMLLKCYKDFVCVISRQEIC